MLTSGLLQQLLVLFQCFLLHHLLFFYGSIQILLSLLVRGKVIELLKNQKRCLLNLCLRSCATRIIVGRLEQHSTYERHTVGSLFGDAICIRYQL